LGGISSCNSRITWSRITHWKLRAGADVRCGCRAGRHFQPGAKERQGLGRPRLVPSDRLAVAT
jgi:hypothetical protein